MKKKNIQDLVNRAENAVRADLLSRLKPLKKSDQFSANFEEIQEIENRLNIIDEGRNADKVANYLKSEILDGEKITPHFLRIAKTLSSDSLSKIKKPDGNPFASKKEQEAHIVQFYRDLYSLPDNMPANFTNCVSEFLGADICRHPLVVNSKLSDEEKILLDRPLSIDELDASVKNLNLKSAPGIDRVSNLSSLNFGLCLENRCTDMLKRVLKKGS